ncbi:MAG: HAD-IA family hydrolase [Clostridia bacterium]|nr:HAD-IA family hydrolase [Clostridia bacterium]
MIRAVFLDIDGTVLDFDAFVQSCMREGFRQFGLPPYEDGMYVVFKQINNRLWQQIERGEIVREQLIDLRWQAVFARLGIKGDARAFEIYFRNALAVSAIPVAGAGELLPWLSQRFIVCAASNGPLAQQQSRLQLAGYLPYFHHLFVSEEIGAQKPALPFFERSMARLNAGQKAALRPEETLMVGDSLTSDMAGGIGFGMKTCFFNPHGRRVPDDMPIDCVIGQLSELKTILEKEESHAQPGSLFPRS